MSKEEMNNKLVRLNSILHEAKGIIEGLEEHVNGRMLADLPAVSIFELMMGSGAKQVRFHNAAKIKGVYTIKDLLGYRYSLKAPRSLLGHSSLKFTEIYVRAVDKLKKEAINSLPTIDVTNF